MTSVDDLLKAAGAALKNKDAAGTARALEDALVLVRKDAPLDIRVACPINHDHTGIGLYTPAKNDVIDGRRVRIYCEVANHTLTPIGDGVWHAQLDVTGDFTYEDATKLPSEIVKLQEGVPLGTQAFDTRSPLDVTSFGVELKLGDKSPAGTYHVALHVKDALSNKRASKDVRFILR